MTADVLAAAGNQGYVIAGMLLFIVAFVLLALRALAVDRTELARRANLPLADDGPPHPAAGSIGQAHLAGQQAGAHGGER